MSGFASDWLALREPADRAARDAGLISQLAAYLQDNTAPTLIDLGCGTGSTWRNLHAHLPENAEWLLLDHDPKLLREAQRRIGRGETVKFQEFELNRVADLPLKNRVVVTASALFDLASESFSSALVDRLADHQCVLYAALNYDGQISWTDAHPLDSTMVAAFNQHQQTEKQFGRALGPTATSCLEELLGAKGYKIDVNPSPWHLGGDSKALQTEFLGGLRQPLLEMNAATSRDLESWLSYRLASVDQAGSLCTVGHTDLLAFPD